MPENITPLIHNQNYINHIVLVLSIGLFLVWVKYDIYKKNKEITKQRELEKKQLEYERKKEAYFRQKAELLKTIVVNTSDETEQLESEQPETQHLKYKPVINRLVSTKTPII